MLELLEFCAFEEQQKNDVLHKPGASSGNYFAVNSPICKSRQRFDVRLEAPD